MCRLTPTYSKSALSALRRSRLLKSSARVSPRETLDTALIHYYLFTIHWRARLIPAHKGFFHGFKLILNACVEPLSAVFQPDSAQASLIHLTG